MDPHKIIGKEIADALSLGVPMTSLSALKEMYEKATQGAWFIACDADGRPEIIAFCPNREEICGAEHPSVPDAHLIQALHNYFPSLALELEAARKVVEAARRVRLEARTLTEAEDVLVGPLSAYNAAIGKEGE